MELGPPRVANRYAVAMAPRLDIVEELGLALPAPTEESKPVDMSPEAIAERRLAGWLLAAGE